MSNKSSKLQTGKSNAVQITSFTASVRSGTLPLIVTFQATAQGGGQPYDKWIYNFGDGNSKEDTKAEQSRSLQSQITYTYKKPGTFPATLTITDANFKEYTSIPITITINPRTISVRVTADPDVGFSPLDVTLKAFPTGGVSPYTISWNFDDGSPPTDKNEAEVSHTFTSNRKFKVRVDIQDAASETGYGIVVVSVGQVPNPKDVKISIFLAIFQNGIINLIGRVDNLTQDSDMAVIVSATISDPSGVQVFSQNRKVVIDAEKYDKPAFLYTPLQKGSYSSKLELWGDSQGTIILGSAVAKITVS